MHWLHTLDIGLFHFINRSLVNPFFDWLMPLLSNNGFFFPILLLLAVVLLWKGGRRMRVCVLMLALILPLGDNFVCNPIKHAVARPRPFVTLPEARLFGTIGKGYIAPQPDAIGADMTANLGSHNSMPSSHAANWFAGTMICFLFYRRSLWFMLPLALGVSFSRIYNGVHYPSDVLAGAILGAGYAVAGLVALQMIWNGIGEKWFPLWHAQLPALLNPEIEKQKTEGGKLDSKSATLNLQWLRLGYVLIFAMLIARWLYLAFGPLNLVKDEAYQWVWSKHLALSYYSKPPGIAFIQAASTSLFGDTEFGVRFFSPLFAAILSAMVLRFFAREVSARAAFLLLLIVTATPLLDVGTILMTIDPPMVLCWMWALIAGWRAVQPDGKIRDWLVVGLAMGLGFLCKYTAVCQIVCWMIFFALSPMARWHLRKPGPWLALLVFLVCTAPVIIWNAQHGWITVHHVAGDAGLHSEWQPTLRYFGDFVFSEGALLNPIFFIGSIWAMFGFWKLRRERPLWLYFFCMGTPLFLGYWLYSFHSRVLPNWIAPAIPPMFCLMVVYWREKFAAGARFIKRVLIVSFAYGLIAMVVIYDSGLIGKIAGQPLPGEMDPVGRALAWPTTTAFVEAAREKLEAEGKPVFILTDHYGVTGLLSFYLPAARAALKSEPLVYCFLNADEPINQFYFWPQYDYRASRQGQNAIYVTDLDTYPLEDDWPWKWLRHEPIQYERVPRLHPMPKRIAQEFESVSDLGVQDVKIGGRIFRHIHLWACYNLK
jgi:4-amino-4-deoxy-L-arabinose transferase-like glycosyltransferase/membrane-associated phospholipid phosphatase